MNENLRKDRPKLAKLIIKAAAKEDRKLLTKSSIPVPKQQRTRTNSLTGLEELIQCGICLERLVEPRMLHCQHTFCLSCLQTHLIAKNLKMNTPVDIKMKIAPSNIISLVCPLCQQEVKLDGGFDALEKLPRNLYIDSLLKLVEEKSSPVTPKVEDYRCVKCHTVSKQQEQICQHCLQIFCSICWNEHLSEMDSNLSILLKQLTESENRLKYKAENYVSRCERLKNTIQETIQQKIEDIKKIESEVLLEVESIKKQGNITRDNIGESLKMMKDRITSKTIGTTGSFNRVTTYMNLHRETSQLLNEVNHYGEARITFDPDTLRLDECTEGIYNDVGGTDFGLATVSNPMENSATMARHYKSRSFAPKLLWTKCPRPAGVAIPPWDQSKIYIAATDSHNVLILDRAKFKLLGRLNDPEMICPTGLVFSASKEELYVTDKWKHCIHVFSKQGTYLRNMCLQKIRSPDGIAIGPNDELVVCDTGNDQVVIVNPESGVINMKIRGGRGRLNMPTSVAVYGNSIIVSDTGNSSIKVFKFNGELTHEFGTLGKNQGQFRSAEAVAVDPLGFILVGDAGNARIQVFTSDGKLVKIFGGKQGFGWVSGIFVTQDLDIITTDSRTRTLTIF